MNRKERRIHERKYGKVSAMQQYREDAINEGRTQSLELILLMTAYTIDYKLELPEEKLQDLMNVILSNIDSYRTGQLNHEDFQFIKNEMAKKGIIIN